MVMNGVSTMGPRHSTRFRTTARTAFCGTALVALLAWTGWRGAATADPAFEELATMHTQETETRPARPPIDLALPKRTETATFALG